MSLFRRSTYDHLVILFSCLLFAASLAQAQNGAITGTVRDNQRAVIPGAHVTLIDQERAGQRKMDSTAEGLFLMDSVSPSTYTLVVEVAGFKKWEKKDIKLYASDRVGVSDIMMEVGQVNETVTVEASAVQLQTESAKVEGVVTAQQMTGLASYDRNFITMLRTIPGVSGLTTSSVGGQVSINGSRNDQVTYKLDGMLNMDMGNNSCCSSMPNMDMISEMKVITNGGTADMGTVGSSQILIMTKSGSQEFHGSLYYLRRHESMDANGWLRNYNNQPRTRNRQNQVGFTLGGPIFIPKLFNVNRQKLYFMVSEELRRNLSPNTTQATVPSQLERNGDFTQSRRANDNTAVIVLDGLNARTAFPGNIIPANRWNADARKLMSLMPLPNVSDAVNYQYNYRLTNTSNYADYLSQAYKIDYNISDRWRVWSRFSRDYNEAGSPTGMGSFEFDPSGKKLGWSVDWRTSWNAVFNLTTIINSTTTNEFQVGGARNSSHYWMDNATYLRSNLGLSYSNPYPAVTIADYGPRVTFAGTGSDNYPNLGTQRPWHADNPDYQLTDNFTKVFSRHTLKAGFTYQIDRKDQDPWNGTTHPGVFQFSRDSSNPSDTDYQYANMLTGAFQTFQQLQKVVEGRYVFHQGEWYAMDTWKVRRNLTLDLGLRFSVFQPAYDAKGQMATFSPALYDPSKAVQLYGYAPGNKAVDPTTGVLYPAVLRGAIVTGSGNIDNGFTITGKGGTPAHLMPYAGIQVAPRIGIAWQPDFLPKTVIRVGAGVFKERMQNNVSMDAQNSPPTNRISTLRFGNVSDISGSLYNIYTPPGLSQSGYTGSGKIPTTINWNFSLERELPSATLVTVSYVGSISRHMIYLNRMNEPAYGSAWLPAAQDPTNAAPKFDGTTSLPIDFYRPYRGIGTMNLYGSGASSNHNALQVQVQKRMSRKLSYGLAYTWSKTLGIGENQWSLTNPWNRREYDYGRVAYDRTQVLSANFIYHMPKFGGNGNLFDHKGLRLVLNDWEFSGIVMAQTGTPVTFGYPGFSADNSNINRRYTGQDTMGPRPVLGDWKLPSDQMTELRQFNIQAIQPAALKGSVGLESGVGYWSNPTSFLSSPEIALMKNAPFSRDGRRYVQLRVEMFNILNHHDWTGRNTGVTFQSPTDLTITNLPLGVATGTANGGRFGFGALNGAAAARRMQLNLRIYF